MNVLRMPRKPLDSAINMAVLGEAIKAAAETVAKQAAQPARKTGGIMAWWDETAGDDRD